MSGSYPCRDVPRAHHERAHPSRVISVRFETQDGHLEHLAQTMLRRSTCSPRRCSPRLCCLCPLRGVLRPLRAPAKDHVQTFNVLATKVLVQAVLSLSASRLTTATESTCRRPWWTFNVIVMKVLIQAVLSLTTSRRTTATENTWRRPCRDVQRPRHEGDHPNQKPKWLRW